MNQLKNEVSNVIVTGHYIDQCHSFLSTNYDGCKGWDRSELYDVYNMTSWSKAVKKRWGITMLFPLIYWTLNKIEVDLSKHKNITQGNKP